MPKPTQYADRLRGKVAIVTGAGAEGGGIGIGRAIACLFAREGARACVVDVQLERAEQTVRMIEEEGGQAFACAADVTSSADCARIVAAAVERYGAVDILVNNVGIAVGGERVEDLDEARWDRVQEVNLKSAALMAKHALPHLVARGDGTIVNIASIAGMRAHGGGLAYSSSKAGLIALTADLAVMYGRQGVRANAVAPGHLFTPIVAAFFDEQAKAERRGVSPLGVEGDAWDVAQAALFLAGPEARFITGVCLPVDGGVTAIAPLAAHALLKSL